MRIFIFQSFGTTRVLREQSKITLRIGAIELCISFKTLVLILSGPAALWALRLITRKVHVDGNTLCPGKEWGLAICLVV